MRQRRHFLRTGLTAGAAWLAGCPEGATLLDGSTPTPVSWAAAFERGTTSDERAFLRETPVQINHVDSRTEVKTALGVLAWARAIEEVPTETLSELKEVVRTAEDVREQLFTMSQWLEKGLALVETMKETQYQGVSIWRAAISVSPSLDQFETATRKLNEELEQRAKQAARIKVATKAVVTHFKQVRSSRVTAYGQLPQAIGTTVSEYKQVIQEVGNIQKRISLLQEISAKAAQNASQLPTMIDRVESYFESLHSLLTTINERLEEFQSAVKARQKELIKVRQAAQQKANQHYSSVSEIRTGSPKKIDVMSIKTNVDAYDSEMVGSVPELPSKGASSASKGASSIDALVIIAQGNSGGKEIIEEYYHRSPSLDSTLPILVSWNFDISDFNLPFRGSITAISGGAGPNRMDFLDRFQQEYGSTPGEGAAMAYDASAVLLLANLAAGENRGTAIRDQVWSVANPPGKSFGPQDLADAAAAAAAGDDLNYTGASGIVDFDKNGGVTAFTFKAVRYTYEQNKVNTLEVGSASEAEQSATFAGSGADRAVRLGILMPLSGALSHFGRSWRNGAKLPTLQLMDNSPFTVDFDVMDTKMRRDKSVSAAESLVDAGYPAICGVTFFFPSVAKEVLIPNKITYSGYTSSRNSLKNTDLFFPTWPSSALKGRALAKQAHEQGISTVAVLYQGDNWERAQAIRKSFIQAFQNKYDGGIQNQVAFEPESHSYESIIKSVLG